MTAVDIQQALRGQHLLSVPGAHFTPRFMASTDHQKPVGFGQAIFTCINTCASLTIAAYAR